MVFEEYYISDIGKKPILTKAEERELLKDWPSQRVKDELVERNVRFCIGHVMRIYMNLKLPKEDIVCEALHGMVYATSKFDPTKNLRFATYAKHWAVQYVLEAERKHRLSLSGYGYKLENERKVKTLRARLEQEKSRTVSNEEVYQDLPKDWSDTTKTWATYNRLEEMRPAWSDRQVEDIGGRNSRRVNEGMDRFTYEDIKDVEEPDFMLSERIHEAIDKLNPRHKRFIRWYYGFDENMTYDEIGQIEGLSRERVRQVMDQAKERLKWLLRRLEDHARVHL